MLQVEVDILGSPTLIVLKVSSVDVKQHLTKKKKEEEEEEEEDGKKEAEEKTEEK